jgi:hypothetical protein
VKAQVIGDQACLVLVDCAVRLALDPEDPFCSNYVLANFLPIGRVIVLQVPARSESMVSISLSMAAFQSGQSKREHASAGDQSLVIAVDVLVWNLDGGAGDQRVMVDVKSKLFVVVRQERRCRRLPLY